MNTNTLRLVHKAPGGPPAAARLEDLLLRFGGGERTPELYLALANCYGSQGNAKKAEHYLRQLLASHPGHEEGRVQLALCLTRLERWEEAIAEAQSCLDAAPDCLNAHLVQASCYMEMDRLREAIEACRRALEIDPGNPQALATRSEATERLEATGVASQEMPPASNGAPGPGAWPAIDADSPGIAPLEETLAAAALAVGDYAAVIRHASNLIQIDAEHYEAWFLLGYAHQSVEQYEEALFAYHQAARLRAGDYRLYVNMGEVRQALEDFQGACDAYNAALELEPNATTAMWNLAVAIERSGGEGGADLELLYEKLTAGDDSHGEAWFGLGVARLKKGDNAGAAQAFRRCLELRASWPEARLNLGLAALRAGEPETAETAFQAVLRFQPGNVAALKGLAAAAVERGNLESAMQCRRKLFELRIGCPELTFNIALLLEESGRGEHALRMYCEAVKERPVFPEALLNLGHLLARQGKNRDASECWKRALSLRPSLAEAYFEGRG